MKKFQSPTVEDAEDEEGESDNEATSPESKDNFTMPDSFIAPEEDIIAEEGDEEEQAADRDDDVNESWTLEANSMFFILFQHHLSLMIESAPTSKRSSRKAYDPSLALGEPKIACLDDNGWTTGFLMSVGVVMYTKLERAICLTCA